DLDAGGVIDDRKVAITRGNRVVDGRQGAIRAPDRPPREPESLERLGRRHLVQEVEVDVEKVGDVVRAALDDVRVPDLVEEGTCAHADCSSCSSTAVVKARVPTGVNPRAGARSAVAMPASRVRSTAR